jgi:hypothetical protein
LKDIQLLLKGLECIKQTKDETVRFFGVRFQRLLYQIPESHRPKGKYLVYLYTIGLLGHLSFLLNKKGQKTLDISSQHGHLNRGKSLLVQNQ